MAVTTPRKSPAARDAGRELLGGFCTATPATTGDFADWTRICADDARRRFTELAGELQEVSWDGQVSVDSAPATT